MIRERPVVAATLVAGLLVLAAGTATAAWRSSDPCRDLSSSAGMPVAPTAPDYLGLSVTEATELGKSRGVALVRVACRDRESLLGTADLRPDRINIGVRGEVVVGAAAY